MGSEQDEIIQRFRVIDSGATAALEKIDSKINEVKESTAQLDKHTKKGGDAFVEMGKKMVGLGEHHLSARHAIKLFSEATDIGRGGIMTMIHSMGMLGPAVGGALGGFILLKEMLESQAEEAAKAKERYDQLSESVRKYRELRKEKAEVLEYGAQGAEAGKEQLAADDLKHAAQKRLNLLETGHSANYGSKGSGGKAAEFVGFFWDQMKSVFTGESEEDYKGRMENEKSDLRTAIGQMNATEKQTQGDKDKYKRWNEINKDSQKELNVLEIKSTYARGENLDILEEQFAVLHKQVQEHKEIAKHETDAVAKAEMLKQIQSEEIALANKYNERDDKYYARGVLMRQSKAPGAFATGEEKAKFGEETRFAAEMHESEKAGINTESIKKRHEENLAKIELERKDQLMMESTAIDAQKLKNQGKTYEAELAMADARARERGDKHKGDIEQQKMDEEAYKAEIEKITIDHDNQEAAFLASNREEILRLKGDAYGAERTQLDEWLREEKEKHVGHEEELKALYAKKSADINRRETEERTKVLGGYRVELTAALMGQGAGSVLRMQQEHAEKQSEYLRTGHQDYATAENEAYEAKIRRMKHESDLELSSKNKVGFMDIGGAWESFASGLNKNPKEQEQLNEMKTTNQILGRIEQTFGKAQGELVQ